MELGPLVVLELTVRPLLDLLILLALDARLEKLCSSSWYAAVPVPSPRLLRPCKSNGLWSVGVDAVVCDVW